MFSELEYWEGRYREHREPFDWYAQLPVFFASLEPLLSSEARILDLGAGASRLCLQLYDLGYKNVTAVDYCAAARDCLSEQLAARPGLRYEITDALNVQLPPGSFDVVIEKGLTDSIMTSAFEPLEAVKSLVGEVRRVLAPGGVFVSITFDDQERQEILETAGDEKLEFLGRDPVTPPPLSPEMKPPTFWMYKFRVIEGSKEASENPSPAPREEDRLGS